MEWIPGMLPMARIESAQRAMTELELTGQSRTHVIDLHDPACTLHREAAQPFLDLRTAAAEVGIELAPVSGFRDFDAQLRIWNDKFQGRRTLYNRSGRALDRSALTEPGVIEAILWWSALPGASRHHWGSEIDVIDRAALSAGQRPQLVPAEYDTAGPFAKLNAWLNRNMQRFGFFRPYQTDRGGVSPEPWHLSFAPVSVPALGQLTEEVLRRTLLNCEMAGKSLVLERLSEIHQRYVAKVDAPTAKGWPPHDS
jgi:LAS superfamily LD-carboxypeptidase LdcB